MLFLCPKGGNNYETQNSIHIYHISTRNECFLIGKTAHQPSIPVDDVAAYYVDSNGNLNLEMKDVRCINDNWDNPIYTNYLAEQGIPDITAQTENNILNLASVTDYETNGNILTLTDCNGGSWVIEK